MRSGFACGTFCRLRLLECLGAFIQIRQQAGVKCAVREPKQERAEEAADGAVTQGVGGGVSSMKTRSKGQSETARASNGYEKSH